MTWNANFNLIYFYRILSFSNIYVWNVWLLVFPSSLCCDWSLGSLPIIETIWDMRNIWSILLYISLGLLVAIVIRYYR